MATGKRVLLIVSGGIAAYKVLEVIRRLADHGVATRCILTRAGAQFVTPLSLAALSGDKVYDDLFSLTDESEMGHINLSRQADLVLVAPATANILAKMAAGIADDLATTALLATDKPVMVAPAMNVRMWEHPATRDNLALLEGVLEKCLAQSRFNLLDHYLLKVKKLKSRIEEEFYSSDENVVTDLLLYDVHPFLRYLGEQDGSLGETVLEPYFQMLDPQLGILYRQRKDYEKSVEKLNILLGKFMDEEQEKMQKLLPHYFEIYKTDGVEYNIYLGQSILEEGQFLDYHLKDFRLWQLVSLCEATRLVEREARRFPTPLSTAQLIFVYNNPISIRFRMDDKRFDVDGAYNVRYEIIKKRIDKATIKGTEERLTQQGKIAIVYLHEKDHQEYLDYIGYLVEKGYASPEVEELELNRLQGADGLKALRVTVA